VSSRLARRRVALIALVGVVLAGCATGTSTSEPADRPAAAPADRADAPSVELEPVEQSDVESTPSALSLKLDDPLLPAPLVDPSRVVSGGPPPDGIPPVDEPRFLATDDVSWLTDDEPVIALSIGDEHRAYPVQVMVWHEIVNDTVEGRPVSVTYCPLCNSALAFDRRLGDRLLTFGTSGKLYLSDLVMYDRQTESLWSQIEGRAIAGVLTGERLERIPVQTLSWAQWRDAHPDGWVLSRDTGADRDYGRNPYVGYDEAGSDPFLFDGDADPRLEPKERVLGLGDDTDPVAVPLAVLSRERVLAVEVAGADVVLWSAEGLRSALDTADIAEGRQLATTGAFSPVVDGRRLSFRTDGPESFVDDQTGSTWDVLGRAVNGPLAGTRLEAAGHLDTFWFAWAAFHPKTRLVHESR
jgi:hypothetical protein